MIKVFQKHLKILYKRINEIESYIDLIEKQNEFITEIKDRNDLSLSTTNEYIEMLLKLKNSTVNYNAIIISLYGCFENFIDDILREYLEFIVKTDPIYRNLDKKIQDKFYREAIEYLSNPQRFVNYGLEVADVIDNLYKCIKEDSCSFMNLDLVLKHPANLKIGQVNTLLNDVGIADAANQIKRFEKYVTYYMNEKSIDYSSALDLIGKEDNELAFTMLTDLVDRRNSVSHSWNEDDRIALTSIKTTHLMYMKMLCECIFELVCLKYLDSIYKNGTMKKLNKIIKVHTHYILCINSEESKLKKGDFLYIRKNGQACLAEILNIRINQNDVDQAVDNTDIGLLLSIRVKEDYEFYYL